MDSPFWAAVIAATFAFLGTAINLWLTRRVQQATARGLTQQQQITMSDYWQGQAMKLRDEVTTLTARVVTLEAEVVRQEQQIEELQAQLWRLRSENERLRQQNPRAPRPPPASPPQP